MMSTVIVNANVYLLLTVWITQLLLEQRKKLAEVGSIRCTIKLTEHVLLQCRPHSTKNCNAMLVFIEGHFNDLVISAPRFTF